MSDGGQSAGQDEPQRNDRGMGAGAWGGHAGGGKAGLENKDSFNTSSSHNFEGLRLPEMIAAALKPCVDMYQDQIKKLTEKNRELEQRIKHLDSIKKPEDPIGGSEAAGRKGLDKRVPEPEGQNKNLEKRYNEAEDRAEKAENELTENQELNKKVRELDERNKKLEKRCQSAEQELREHGDFFEKRMSELQDMLQAVDEEEKVLSLKRIDTLVATNRKLEAGMAEHDQEKIVLQKKAEMKEFTYSVTIKQLRKQIEGLTNKPEVSMNSHGRAAGIEALSEKYSKLEGFLEKWFEQGSACCQYFNELRNAEKAYELVKMDALQKKINVEKNNLTTAKQQLVTSELALREYLLGLATPALVREGSEVDLSPDQVLPSSSSSTDARADSGYFGAASFLISTESVCWACGGQLNNAQGT